LRDSGAIEQDADLVAFIYREAMYDKETPDKNVAELIIAKHRNGPTDTIKLTFLEKFARFENFSARREPSGG
jgi:replicative DNA helicase